MNVALRRTIGRTSWAFAASLAVILLIANVSASPALASLSEIPSTLAAFAPFAILGMASAPSILSGHGGIDLSVAPTMGIVNAVLVGGLLGTPLGEPWLAIPICLGIGLLIGIINGVSVAVLRFPAVIATLCMYFVLTGITLTLLPTPITAKPNWTDDLAGLVGPVPGALITIGAALLLWGVLRATGFTSNLLATGDNEVAAFTSGVNVTAVRIVAYASGGVLAAVAGIALTALVRTADPNLSGPYILIALAAVAMGGVSLSGGSGGLIGPLLGAACIYLLSLLLTTLRVSAEWVNVAYGGALLVAVVTTATFSRLKEGPR